MTVAVCMEAAMRTTSTVLSQGVPDHMSPGDIGQWEETPSLNSSHPGAQSLGNHYINCFFVSWALS